MGAWVSFDGLNEENTSDYIRLVLNMKNNRVLHRVLLSHDAGWYDPGSVDGGEFRGFPTLFVSLIPQLRKEGFTDNEIHQILVANPAEAFTIRKRRI
jgi:phosphotriesterase-related protein